LPIDGRQKHATSDVGLIFTAYNLRRLFNIIDPKLLKTNLEGLAALFFVFWRPSESKLSVFQATEFFGFKTCLAYGPFLFSPKTSQNAWHGGEFRLFLGL
jgi:hypothetical protein